MTKPLSKNMTKKQKALDRIAHGEATRDKAFEPLIESHRYVCVVENSHMDVRLQIYTEQPIEPGKAVLAYVLASSFTDHFDRTSIKWRD
jgi:hypothetical protein